MPRGTHPNSLKNLKPIEKGEIRNPTGHKRPDTVDRLLREISTETKRYVDPLTGERRMMPHSEKIARELISRAAAGQPHATKLFFERAEGLPVATIHTDDTHDKQWEMINMTRGIISGIGDDVRKRKCVLEAKLKKARGPAAKLKAIAEFEA